jgi:hypothetical protein
MQMTNNLCIKHFPEPIIYISDEPMCKKCIPVYLENMKKKKGAGEKEEEKQEQQTKKLTQMFGNPQLNIFGAEQSIINTCLLKLDDFRGDFRYIHDEIEDRVQESKANLTNLPELMCSIFLSSETFIKNNKGEFLTELDDVIGKLQALMKKDNETKLPNFYVRLS